jgi:hypothetical protein
MPPISLIIFYHMSLSDMSPIFSRTIVGNPFYHLLPYPACRLRQCFRPLEHHLPSPLSYSLLYVFQQQVPYPLKYPVLYPLKYLVPYLLNHLVSYPAPCPLLFVLCVLSQRNPFCESGSLGSI